ncbi:MAG: aminotransferase class V-fold PLP-dependent enzyme [Flavobacteriaceae bacterium]|nr:aminotransferase class V-fold PLP-dependent enzyme [Flavobacteriaceae bacterium]MDG1063363.1 aminotransferase class V-fold PLP-dependent enzyme [Flavobacteriaceae bacterium]MDG1962302.1 aminotransferase class V-fold PLP-dependent enzyme [Flavobacteriaceae bacterium]
MQHTLDKFMKIITTLLHDESDHPVAQFVPSQELFDTIDLSLQKEGIPEEEFDQVLTDLVLKSPRTATNAFFNQLFGGRNDKAVLGDLLAVMLNNSMYTYKAAGPQIGVEKVVLREVCRLIGWGDKADGTFAPGGSMTNYMAMVMARDAYDATIRYKGGRDNMIVYTSKESHYSIPKNAAFSGIGRDNVRYVPTNALGQIDAAALEQMIQNDITSGGHPTMVNLTAGTTVLGAFDAIRPISEICQAHDIWLHVDGAYCGSVLFSDRYKHLIDGIELVDSFSVNAHKMIGTPLSCSIIVAKNKKHLHDSFSNDASYLYQTDHDEFNLGKTSLQCGRRNDALKFWTLWKSVGTNGLAKIVDHQFDLGETARDYIRAHKDYTLYSFEDSISICFNYRNIPARALCTALYEQEELLVGYGSFGTDEFVRFVTINAQNSHQDILDFFAKLERFVAHHHELSVLEVQSS